MIQVYLTMHGTWADVIAEDGRFILAKSVDGIMTYVIRDGQEKMRVTE